MLLYTRAVLIVLAAVAFGTSTAAAQTPASNPLLTGTVTDSATGRPVREAEVTLVRAHRTVFTDSAGRFALRVAGGTEDTATIDLMGYGGRAIPLVLGDEGMTLNVQLAPVPLILKGITALARDLRHRQHWTSSAQMFYRRDLLTANGNDLLAFLRERGQYVPHATTVYFDDFRLASGFEGVPRYPLSDIYAVQVVNRRALGVDVYVYSVWYMGWMARYGGRLAWY